jgi:hypothetical protein
VVISDQRAAAFSVIARPLYSCLLLTRRKLNHALASVRALAPAVPGIRIEELFEIGEAKGRQLLFVPIACGSHCFKIAYDLARDCASKSLRPDFFKMQSTISLITHRAAIAALQHPALIPSTIGSPFNGSRERAEQLAAGHSHGNWAEDAFYSCGDGDFERCQGVQALGRGLPPRWARLAIASVHYQGGRPSGAGPAIPAVIAIGAARAPASLLATMTIIAIGVALAFRSERRNGASAKA